MHDIQLNMQSEIQNSVQEANIANAHRLMTSQKTAQMLSNLPSPPCLCHELTQEGGASLYLLHFLIVGCCDVLITDWIAGVIVNGKHHVELEEVHQLHKQPCCTAHRSPSDIAHAVQKHADTCSIVIDRIVRQCVDFDRLQAAVRDCTAVCRNPLASGACPTE